MALKILSYSRLVISYLLIVSILLPQTAFAMRRGSWAGGEDHKTKKTGLFIKKSSLSSDNLLAATTSTSPSFANGIKPFDEEKGDVEKEKEGSKGKGSLEGSEEIHEDTESSKGKSPSEGSSEEKKSERFHHSPSSSTDDSGEGGVKIPVDLVNREEKKERLEGAGGKGLKITKAESLEEGSSYSPPNHGSWKGKECQELIPVVREKGLGSRDGYDTWRSGDDTSEEKEFGRSKAPLLVNQQTQYMEEVLSDEDQGRRGAFDDEEEIEEVFSPAVLEDMPPEKLEASIEHVEEDGGYYKITFRLPALKQGEKVYHERSPLRADEENPDPLTNFAPKFVLKTNSLSPELKDKLGSLQRRVIHGKWEWPEYAGLGVGGIIGLGMCVAMLPVFNGGFGYLADHWHLHFLFDFISSSAINNAIVIPYIVLSIFPDAVPRNIETWQKAFRAIKEKTVEWGGVVKRSLAVLIPSLLEPTYLILVELHDMEVTHTHGVNNQFAVYMLIFSPILFTDAMASNYGMAGEAMEDFKDWFLTSPSWLARKMRGYFEPCISRGPPSPEATLKQDFRNTLHNLNLNFLVMEEAKINVIDKAVFESDAELKDKLQGLTDEEFEWTKGFLTLRYLLSLGKKVPQIVDEEEGETWGSILRKALLISGSPARLLVLEFVLETLLGLFLPPGVATGLGWVAGAVSFPTQSGLEHVGLKHLSELWTDSEEGHNSHVGARRTVKGITIFQGIMFTLPMIVLCAQVAIHFFGSPYWVIGAIPFILAETATQLTSFHGTYNKTDTSALTSFHNLKTRKCLGRDPRVDYKRDRLMRKVTEYIDKLDGNGLSPQLLKELSRLVEFEDRSDPSLVINDE